MATYNQHPSSFRDPSGFVFEIDGKFFRQVNKFYEENYQLLIQSGLYQSLTQKKWLIEHEVIDSNLTGSSEFYLTIQPRQLSTISYAYEWCFNELKDAALLTLNIVKEAIGKGMILKDATPYNIQFERAKPIFIDTLSFEKYDESKPWIAYRQFCETFLNPLLISKHTAMPVSKIYQAYPEGISSTQTASILPFKTKWNMGTALHVHLQASVKSKKNTAQQVFTKTKLLRIIDHLHGMIRELEYSNKNSVWEDYYEGTILNEEYLSAKKNLVSSFVNEIDFSNALDIGSNDGVFSELLPADKNVTAIDADESCINALYQSIKNSGRSILPLCIDISNPSPAFGWNNTERKSFLNRVNAELVLALALIHHLCIAKNISLEMCAELFAVTKSWLLIEFVPKEDEKAQQLLSTREDIFPNYDQAHFEQAFNSKFSIIRKEKIGQTSRTLYLMQKK